MGFTGSVILANSRLPLDELDAIVERDDDLYIMIDFRDGWKLGGIFESIIENDAENMLAELVQATGMPAMTGYVIDSDCVDLKALGARSGPWRACLIRAVMADYSKSELGLPFESTFLPPEVATVKATAWAFEAGLEPAMTGYVIDSDCVDLKALGARSGPWRACLIRAVMADYSKSELGLPFESTFLPPEVATVKATAWAFEAGLEPDQEGLSALFADEEDDRDGLSEFHRLIHVLGVPGPGQRRY